MPQRNQFPEVWMRRQAKPFTVEVRKSRKAGTGPEPLFSAEMLALEAEPARRAAIPGPALFSTPAPGKPRILEATGEAERPSTRILPDLSTAPVQPVPMAPEPDAEERAERTPRPRKPRKPRAIAALPIDIETEEEDAEPVEIRLPRAPVPASRRVMPSQAERRAKRNAAGIPVLRWERWKRRLPPVLR